MEPKQAKMKELIVGYFQQREDTEISQNAGGIYRVQLKSEAARADFGGRRQNGQISLVFDPDHAYLNPECELISVGHPFLEVIRNDLEQNATYEPRLTEAHLLPQLIDPMGQLSLPYVVFSSHDKGIRYHLSYHPTIILTYSIIYEDDERSENVVRLCYDGITSALRPDVIGQMEHTYPIDGPPVEGHLLIDSIDIMPFLVAGRKGIEERVAADSKIKARENGNKFEEERKRLKNHYETEIANIRDHVTRKQLEETMEKNIADAERKFGCEINIRLLSIQRLWWPIVDYTASFASHRDDFQIGDIRYDMIKGYTDLFCCESCGNRTHFDVCAAGKHVICGGQCSTGLLECSACHDPFCSSHGSSCNGCSAPICQHDRQQCSYGRHSKNEYFCARCLVQSFEGRPLCTECQELCDLCHRAFPHELMSRCRIGNERVCTGHTHSPDAYKCLGCGQVTCKDHGIPTSDGNWACQDHAEKTSCCGEIHAKSHLYSCCVDPREILCSKHKFTCLGCKKPVCSTHSRPLTKHKDQVTCEACRRACGLCGAERHFLANDLATCNTCGKSVCANHRAVCKVGGEIVCRNDLRISVNKEPLCSLHAANCVQCGTEPTHPIYRSDKLRTCSICHNTVCQKHSEICMGCNKPVCNAHRKPLAIHKDHFTCDVCRKACELCGSEQHYLANDLIACSTCGKPVCADHRAVCKVGGETVCRNDLRISVNQEPLCYLHAANCIQCGTGPTDPIYRTDSLRTCSICRNPVCEKHSSVCSICGATHVCKVHLDTQPTCESCGRSACGSSTCKSDSSTCRTCGMKYCHHCINTSTGRCKTCEELREAPLGDNWLQMLRKIQGTTTNEETSKALASMLKSPDRLSLLSASNRTYGVFVVRYAAKWYQVWKSSVQIRIVVTRTGRLKMAKVEELDS